MKRRSSRWYSTPLRCASLRDTPQRSMKVILAVIGLTIFLIGCSKDKAEKRNLLLSEQFRIIHEIDPELELVPHRGNMAKGLGLGELGSWEDHAKEVDYYIAEKKWGDIELSVYLYTYDSPEIFDSGEIKLIFPKGYFDSHQTKIKEIVEKYILGFVEEFVSDIQIKEALVASAYEYRSDTYVPPAHVKKIGSYYVDLYFRQDFGYWETHDTITFTIE